MYLYLEIPSRVTFQDLIGNDTEGNPQEEHEEEDFSGNPPLG